MTKSNTALNTKIKEYSVMTSRAQYAITALLKLYHYSKSTPLSLGLISEQEDISISYLEQLFSGLRKHGIVKSYRGPGGGYVLAKDAKDIRISDVMVAAEDCAPARRPKKTAEKKTGSDANYSTAMLWDRLNSFILDITQNISLEDVANSNMDISKAITELKRSA